MNNQMQRGFTDQAADEDLFNISHYVTGLVKYIETCNTPMTISIQGSWGTGKTSLMNFIERELKKTDVTYPIKFNTWQFSQFNMQDRLALSLISSMMSQMKVKGENKSMLQKSINVLGAVGNGLWQGVRAVTDAKLGGVALENMDKMAEGVKSAITGNEEPYYDIAVAITDLHEQFEQCVKDTKAITGKDRIVIFIDDLDRLEPAKAVELLEVLKLFFDCPDCVFVLAIDYEVVVRGVSAKYGRFSDSDEENAAKGRSFFDKIIQVPFKMPTGMYDFKNYIAQCFSKMGITYEQDEIKDYEELIKLSIGTNPRSMKRLFNAFLLLSIVVDDEILTSDRNKQLLFSTLCLQYSFEGIYNLILRNLDDLSSEFLHLIISEPLESLEVKYGQINVTDSQEAKLHAFMEKFIWLIDKDHSGELDDHELDALKSVLRLSSITNASETEEKPTASSSSGKTWKKVDYIFEGKTYKSGSRHRDNLGFLAHDIIVKAAHDMGWSRQDFTDFREYYCSLGSTGWLNEVVLFADEVSKLPNDLQYFANGNKDGKDPITRRNKVICIEGFAHTYLNILPDNTPGITYDIASATNDPDSIILPDNAVVYTARYWGDNDIKKLTDLLNSKYGYTVSLHRNQH